MKFKKPIKLLVIAAMVSTMFINSISIISAAAPVMLGYYTGDTASDNALHANYSYMTDMSTDTFNATTTGNIVGTTPTSAITFANSKNIKTYACISNFGTTDFDPALAHSVLTNATAKKNLITKLVNLVQNNGYKGVNVDFEAVLKTDRTALSNFMRDLANSLRPLGYKTLISAPATTNGDPNDDWSGAFDYASLGQNVDYIQVMTYDQNGPWSAPGPVAGKDWMGQSLQYAVSVVPPAKVLMGLPAYGYDWNLTAGSGVQVAWTAIPALISSTGAVVQYDTATASPHFTYKANGQSHVVWYENAQSVTEKSAFYNTLHLGGISMWAEGLEDASFWQAVKSATPTATPAPIKIEAENYSSMSGVQLEKCTDVGGGTDVGWIDPNDWMNYKVNIQAAGNYSLQFRVASPVTGGKFQVKNAAGTILGTLTIPNTGGYQTWQTANLNITLPAGSQTLKILLTTGEPNLNWLSFVKIP